jgi:hypothetical protein
VICERRIWCWLLLVRLRAELQAVARKIRQIIKKYFITVLNALTIKLLGIKLAPIILI